MRIEEDLLENEIHAILTEEDLIKIAKGSSVPGDNHVPSTRERVAFYRYHINRPCAIYQSLGAWGAIDIQVPPNYAVDEIRAMQGKYIKVEKKHGRPDPRSVKILIESTRP